MAITLPGGVQLPFDYPAGTPSQVGGVDVTLVLIGVILLLVLLLLVLVLMRRKPPVELAPGQRGYFRPGPASRVPSQPSVPPAPAAVASTPVSSAPGKPAEEPREQPIPDVLAVPPQESKGAKALPEVPSEVGEKPPEPRLVEVIESCEVDIFSPFKLFNGNTAGQQFLASGERVVSAALKAYKQGSPNDLVLELREDADGLPSKTVLAVETLPASQLSTNLLGAWVSAPLMSRVEKGRKYWLVFRQKDYAGDGSNRIEVKGVYRDEYKNGICAESPDGGRSWNKRSYYDTAFKIALERREYG